MSFGLIKNHAFIDGNKRVGPAVLVAFLRMNGYIISVPMDERIAIVKRVAASEMNEEAWTAWVEHSVTPVAS